MVHSLWTFQHHYSKITCDCLYFDRTLNLEVCFLKNRFILDVLFKRNHVLEYGSWSPHFFTSDSTTSKPDFFYCQFLIFLLFNLDPVGPGRTWTDEFRTPSFTTVRFNCRIRSSAFDPKFSRFLTGVSHPKPSTKMNLWIQQVADWRKCGEINVHQWQCQIDRLVRDCIEEHGQTWPWNYCRQLWWFISYENLEYFQGFIFSIEWWCGFIIILSSYRTSI